MLDIYATLEINEILTSVASYSHSEIAKERILSLKILPSVDEVIEESNKLDEMMRLLFKYFAIPLNNSFNLEPYVELANKGGILTPEELSRIQLDIYTSIKINEFFVKIEKNGFPILNSMVKNLFDLTPLYERIDRILTPNLLIKDDASPDLARIRRDIRVKEDNVRKVVMNLVNRFKDYLTESTYTIRNGHFVLPFKSGNKNKVEGIIHDVSDSGMTTFIEPSQLVEISNDIFVLKTKERDEIQKILKEVTMEVGKVGEEVKTNNLIIAELDFLAAKARYAIDNNEEVANFTKEKRVISLADARHPLIDKDKFVPNSFELNKDSRLIVISGPNAGGKTVAMKTLGLLILMAELGLAIPTSKKAELSYFPKIYADIGDNQSLSDNLSTFSAHISNIARITRYVTHDDLVLIDELGTGTSPLEGEAIAISVIEYLFKKECFAIISSHFDRVKEYAYSKEGITNAMMIFDDKNLLPTYRLRIGLPGKSYGLEMAKRYHLDDEIINNAKKRIGKEQENSVSEVMEKLNNLLKENEELQTSLNEKERVLEHKEKELLDKEEKLNNKKETLLEDVKQEKEELIAKAKEDIKAALRALSNPNATQKELLEARKEIEKIEAEDDVEEIYIEEDLFINDYVYIPLLNQTGRIKDIKGDKLVVISNDGMSIKTTKDKVRKTKETKGKPKPQPYNGDEILRAPFSLELNIIGEHIDEALPKVMKYIDDARLRHIDQVRIIHGKGSGALRKMVRDYLKSCDFIKEFHSGGYYDGGDGATIVVFK